MLDTIEIDDSSIRSSTAMYTFYDRLSIAKSQYHEVEALRTEKNGSERCFRIVCDVLGQNMTLDQFLLSHQECVFFLW
jgi:hypothetical protein